MRTDDRGCYATKSLERGLSRNGSNSTGSVDESLNPRTPLASAPYIPSQSGRLRLKGAARPDPIGAMAYGALANFDILATLKDGDSFGVEAGCLDRFGGFLLHRAA